MRRVVVTGIGFITSLGFEEADICAGLKEGLRKTVYSKPYEEHHFECRVWAPITAPLPGLNVKQMKYMGKGMTLLYGYLAAQRAVANAGLTLEDLHSPRVGAFLGTGGPSTEDQCDGYDTAKKEGPKKLTRIVPPTMSSGLAAKVATDFGILGKSYEITAACSTSALCIGEAAEKIAYGKQDIMLAGGSEDCHPSKACGFDGMMALVRGFNDRPEEASRPFDADHAGFVDGAGGVVLVLEELEHARARGARIRAEIVGFGNTSDGYDMTVPSGRGAIDCMKLALEGFDGQGVGRIDHVLAHGTSTPTGDLPEAKAIAEVFGDDVPWVTAPKGNVGHTLGAAGALAVGFGILSMEGRFVPKCVNIDRIHPDIEALGLVAKRIVRETMDVPVNAFMANAFGFGGTNASLVVRRYDG